MMLVQKPPTFNLNALHRRHPSSPVVVHVQPTHTPGLLTLSKPIVATPPRVKQQQRQRTPPSQAEGVDPFVVTKSQRRRKPQPQPINIPVASVPKAPTSRSLPLPHHRPAKRTLPPLLPPFDFPICDDMSDDDDAPPTPTRPSIKPKPQSKHSKPKSRPTPPSPSPSPKSTSTRPRPRNHKRAPSESGMVFAMSSDESGPETSNDELNALFKNMALHRAAYGTPPPAQRERMYEAMAKREVQGYFASSMFQNSPSPEELPDPLFV